MKKFFKFLLIFILILVGVVGGTGAILYSQINDDTTFVTDEELRLGESYYNIKHPLNKIITKGLSNIQANGVIEFDLEPSDFDHLLESIVYLVDEQIPQITTHGTDVQIIDNVYYLDIAVQTPVCPTVCKVQLEFEEWGKTFKIHVNDISLGNLSLNNDLVNNLLTNIDVTSLHNSLENQGIYCTIDLNEKTISISQEQLYDMIHEQLFHDKNFPLYKTLFELIKKNELYTIDTTSVLNLSIDINSLGVAYNYTNVEIFNMIKYYIMDLLQQNVIHPSQVNDVFDYLLNGYKNCNKTLINSLDFSGLILDKNNHPGFYYKDQSSMKEIISNTNVNIMSSNSINLIIDEYSINKVITNSDLIGKSFAFGYQDHITNEVDVAYIVIDSLNLTLLDNKLMFNLYVNINGYQIGVTASFFTNTSNSLEIKGTLDSISLGFLELSSSQSTTLLNYLSDVISEDWIEIIGKNNEIKIDFADIISGNNQISNFLNSSSSSKSVTCETKEGQFVLTFKS